jgi:hypothetical protein
LVHKNIHIIVVERDKLEMDYEPQRKHSITLKDKAIFTAFVIILIVIIAILINSNYYNSVRDNLMSADFMVPFAISDSGYDEGLYCDCVRFIPT